MNKNFDQSMNDLDIVKLLETAESQINSTNLITLYLPANSNL
uniref:Uncharacterized protein n=1 Tax=Moumouvirus sp. 'Monve' TaxID=1128131 RepID=H2EG15_9VIRU|nr:hypothetical protein mv_L865 [Moumouvirus Monve]